MSKPTLGKFGASLRGLGAMRPAGFPLSVEFGVGSLKVLQLSSGEPPALVAAAQLDTPDDLLDNAGKRLAYQIEALPKLIKRGKFKTNRAVCAVPVGQMVCKHLQIVPDESIAIEKLAAAQLASQLGCDPDSLLVRCKVVESVAKGNKQEVVCFAAARDFVSRLMGALKSAKLEPVGIHNEFTASIRAVDTASAAGQPSIEQDGTPSLILDMGTGSTKVMVVHGSRLVFARSIEIGSRHMDHEIARQLRCTTTEAYRTRMGLESVTPAPARVAAAPASEDESEAAVAAPSRPVGPQADLTEPLEILTDEASMCLRYHRSMFPDRPVERVMFLGGQSRQRIVCEHIARVLKLPAQSIDPMARVARSGKVPGEGVDLSQAQPGWATPVGMCLSPTDL